MATDIAPENHASRGAHHSFHGPSLPGVDADAKHESHFSSRPGARTFRSGHASPGGNPWENRHLASSVDSKTSEISWNARILHGLAVLLRNRIWLSPCAIYANTNRLRSLPFHVTVKNITLIRNFSRRTAAE